MAFNLFVFNHSPQELILHHDSADTQRQRKFHDASSPLFCRVPMFLLYSNLCHLKGTTRQSDLTGHSTTAGGEALL